MPIARVLYIAELGSERLIRVHLALHWERLMWGSTITLVKQDDGHISLNVISFWQAYQDIGQHCVRTALHEAMVSWLIKSVILYICFHK